MNILENIDKFTSTEDGKHVYWEDVELSQHDFGGYLRVYTPYGMASVHRIVAHIFCEGYKTLDESGNERVFVDHINTDKYDNSVSNLKWVSVSENMSNPLTKEHISESKTEMWSSMSDDKRKEISKKMTDGQNRRWNNISEEDRNKFSDTQKQRWLNMSDDERKEFSNKQSARWENISEEEYRKFSSNVSSGIANMSEEKKIQRSKNSSIAMKKRFENMTEEEKHKVSKSRSTTYRVTHDGITEDFVGKPSLVKFFGVSNYRVSTMLKTGQFPEGITVEIANSFRKRDMK